MTTPSIDLDRYLARLGLDHPGRADLATLQALQFAHQQAIAFENLSPLAAAPVPLDLPALQRKVIAGGRGGYCFELNTLFRALLQALGFEVAPLMGRVVMGLPEDAAPTPRTHLVTRVRLEGVDWLADVGFGGMTPTGPLRLDATEAQATPHEPYRLVAREAGTRRLPARGCGTQRLLQAQVGGEWRSLYVLDLEPAPLIDHEVGNWYVATHPASLFTQHLVAARPAPGVRRTLRDADLTVHTLGGPSTTRRLGSVDDVIEVLRDGFGLAVPDTPALRARLQTVIAEARGAQD
jgi:N-hydroxyarylamine O-acetyltransferase